MHLTVTTVSYEHHPGRFHTPFLNIIFINFLLWWFYIVVFFFYPRFDLCGCNYLSSRKVQKYFKKNSQVMLHTFSIEHHSAKCGRTSLYPSGRPEALIIPFFQCVSAVSAPASQSLSNHLGLQLVCHVSQWFFSCRSQRIEADETQWHST